MRLRMFLVGGLLLLASLVGAQGVVTTVRQEVDRAHPLLRGLVGWWPLAPGLVGGRSVWNLVGPRHGTLGGTLTYATDPTGKFGAVLRFDGGGGVAQFGNVFAFERTDTFSLVLHFRAASQNNTYLLAKAAVASSTAGYYLKLGGGTSNKVVWSLLDASANCIEIVTTNTTFLDGRDHQVIGTYAGGSTEASMVLAVDGRVQATSSNCGGTLSASIVTTNQLAFGGDANGSNAFTGDIGMVMIYNRVLSTAEIAALAQLRAPDYGGLLPESTIPLLATVPRVKRRVVIE